MNLKMLSIARVIPLSELKADALKPDQIYKHCLSSIIGLDTSKNRGDLPICFKDVSLKPCLTIMLIRFWATELSLLANSPLRFTVVI